MFAFQPPPTEAAAEAVEPGYWETTSRVMGVPRTERRCIRADQVAQFMQGPHNHNYVCTYPVRVVTNGAIRLEGSCKSHHSAPVPVSGHGTFTATTFHMEARVVTHVAGVDIPVHATTDARRISDDCPPGS